MEDDSGLGELCWSAVGGAQSALRELEIRDRGPWLGGPHAVDDLAVGASGAALLAPADLAEARGARRPRVALSAEHVSLSFRSERFALCAGAPVGPGFAPLSRFVRCADEGWARTHGNYPHHVAALSRALGCDLLARADPAVALQEHAAEISAMALEQRVFEAGGAAVALRAPRSWSQSEPGRLAGSGPLVRWGDPPAVAARRALSAADAEHAPAHGVRVLDLTRVIAGPVAGRTLAALGAQVLRVDPPALPELAGQHLDTGAGKLAATLDLGDSHRRERLLAGADVVLIGYRPGSLARFGLDANGLSERHPHLVQVRLSAWGEQGPWAQRRGFDSLVQVASGIATLCGEEQGEPGVLPAQALDHASGHLMAAAALSALAGRERGRPLGTASVSLARVAAALLDAPRPAGTVPARADASAYRVQFGDLSLIAPPGSLDGTPLRWEHGPRPLGGDEPQWPRGAEGSTSAR